MLLDKFLLMKTAKYQTNYANFISLWQFFEGLLSTLLILEPKWLKNWKIISALVHFGYFFGKINCVHFPTYCVCELTSIRMLPSQRLVNKRSWVRSRLLVGVWWKNEATQTLGKINLTEWGKRHKRLLTSHYKKMKHDAQVSRGYYLTWIVRLLYHW